MKRITILLFCITFILTGCFVDTNTKIKIGLPTYLSKDSVILYDRYSSKIISYNTKTYRIEQESNIENYVQYGFNTQNNYYTSGHSVTNGFEILYVRERELKHIYTLKDEKNQAIFPLASDQKHNIFFIINYSNDKTEIDRTIVAFNGSDKLIKYTNTKGCISSGAILDGTLFYTIYNSKEETYSLYSLDLSNYSNHPILIEKGLADDELYVHKGKLYKSDTKSIFNGKDTYNKTFLNYFFDNKNILIQLKINSEATVVMDVIDTRTKKVIGSADSILDFKIENNEVIAYCNGHIDKIILQ